MKIAQLLEQQSDLTQLINAVSQRVARHVLTNAQSDWQQNNQRYTSHSGYANFADWFDSDYLGNDYNIDSVLDNITVVVKKQVIEILRSQTQQVPQ